MGNILKLFILFVTIFFNLSSLHSSSGIKQCLERINSTMVISGDIRVVEELISSISGAKLEIGGGHNPICSDCIQLDKYIGTKDHWHQIENKRAGKVLSDAEFFKTKLGKRYQQLSGEQKRPFVVKGERGIFADASQLPFKSESISMIISKNYQWFRKSSTRDRIEPVLKEYMRVLKKGGNVYLLKNGGENFFEFKLHKIIAEELGFKITLVKLKSPHSSGLMIKKIN